VLKSLIFRGSSNHKISRTYVILISLKSEVEERFQRVVVVKFSQTVCKPVDLILKCEEQDPKSIYTDSHFCYIS